MKNLVIFAIAIASVLIVSCNKTGHIKETKCIGDVSCNHDTLRLNFSSQPNIDSCLKYDGVNLRNLIPTADVVLGDSIIINCDAIGINSSITGNAFFVNSYKEDTEIEVQTFLQYNICNTSLNVLTNLPCIYTYKPTHKGSYTFTFVNIYGGDSKISVQVK